MNRTIEHVVSAIRRADGKCALLIGAGCSKSAGIPLATEILEACKEGEYKDDYLRAQGKAKEQESLYGLFMEELAPAERKAIFSNYIKNSKINWAHLAIAQLFSTGLVDRVLTVNFDHLISRACALVNFFPAIYDIASASAIIKSNISENSLFYLNGQDGGFTILNSSSELASHRPKLEAVVQEVGLGRVWIVAGYSGQSDPLLDTLLSQPRFERDLFWLGFDPGPSSFLQARNMFCMSKRTFYIGSQDADKCLTLIAQGAGCFPPDLLVKPVDYLNSTKSKIDFSTGKVAGASLERSLNEKIELARLAVVEAGAGNLDLIRQWLSAGEYEKVEGWYENIVDPSAEHTDLMEGAYVTWADRLTETARALAHENIAEARDHIEFACEKYVKAYQIRPNSWTSTIWWADCLLEVLVEERRQGLVGDYHYVYQAIDALEHQMTLGELARRSVAYILAALYAFIGHASNAVAQLSVWAASQEVRENWNHAGYFDEILGNAEVERWVKKNVQ